MQLNLPFNLPHIPIYYLIPYLSSLVVIFFFVYRWLKRRNAIIIKILKKYGDTYKVIKKDYIHAKNQEYNYNGKKYCVNLQKAFLDERNRAIQHYDELDSNPIALIKNTQSIESPILEVFLKSNVFEKAWGEAKENMMYILIVISIIAIVGVGLISIYQNQALKTILAELISK